MVLKNNKGIEREFVLLFAIEKNNQKYLIYKDLLTENIYAGKDEDNKLKVLDDSEIEYINGILEKLNG